jgi:acetolactate synthase I/II/III large subunit
MNGAELLVSALENEGVQQIFGIPGEENLDVVDALRRSTIKLVLTRHEQAAAFMAATHGRLTGKVAPIHAIRDTEAQGVDKSRTK